MHYVRKETYSYGKRDLLYLALRRLQSLLVSLSLPLFACVCYLFNNYVLAGTRGTAQSASLSRSRTLVASFSQKGLHVPARACASMLRPTSQRAGPASARKRVTQCWHREMSVSCSSNLAQLLFFAASSLGCHVLPA